MCVEMLDCTRCYDRCMYVHMNVCLIVQIYVCTNIWWTNDCMAETWLIETECVYVIMNDVVLDQWCNCSYSDFAIDVCSN